MFLISTTQTPYLKKRTATAAHSRACPETSPCLHRVFPDCGTLVSASMYHQYISSSDSVPRLRKHPVRLGNPGFRTCSSAGFTLIELLVVIAIIGLLTSIVLVSLTTVRQKSRDARRMQNMQELRNALGLYETTYATYPVSVSATTLTGTDAISQALITAEAIPAAIIDPQHPTYTYTYQSGNGSDYVISFCLETNTIKNYVAGCTNTLTP